MVCASDGGDALRVFRPNAYLHDLSPLYTLKGKNDQTAYIQERF